MWIREKRRCVDLKISVREMGERGRNGKRRTAREIERESTTRGVKVCVGRGTQKRPMYRAQHIVDLFLDYSPSFYLAREFLYARFSARERHSCARCLLRLNAPGRSSVIYDRGTRRNFISPAEKIGRGQRDAAAPFNAKNPRSLSVRGHIY